MKKYNVSDVFDITEENYRSIFVGAVQYPSKHQQQN